MLNITFDLFKKWHYLCDILWNVKSMQEVGLELCGITSAQIGLDDDKLYDGVEIVRSGVVRIAELQRQGFAYIKTE